MSSIARKDDIVAVRIVHSYQSLATGRQEYETWHLARVERATREGKAKTFRLSSEGHVRRLRNEPATVSVLTIPPERQGVCRGMFDAGCAPFGSADELRAAVLAAEPTEST